MSEERERTRVSITPKKDIRFDPNRKREKIVISNKYNVPLMYKFQSTGREFFSVDSASGRIGAQEEITITVSFKVGERLMKKYIENGKTGTKKFIRIRLESRDKTIQLQKQLKVRISFLPKDHEDEDEVENDDGGEPLDSVMFQSIIEEKNVKKIMKVIKDGNEEDGEGKEGDGEEEEEEEEEFIKKKKKDDEEKEKEEEERKVIKKEEKSKNEHLTEERDAKLAFEMRKKKILKSLFRFFPCYFGCLVILLVNHHIGFAWGSLKMTFASFFIGFAVSYIQFEVLNQEKKVKST